MQVDAGAAHGDDDSSNLPMLPHAAAELKWSQPGLGAESSAHGGSGAEANMEASAAAPASASTSSASAPQQQQQQAQCAALKAVKSPSWHAPWQCQLNQPDGKSFVIEPYAEPDRRQWDHVQHYTLTITNRANIAPNSIPSLRLYFSAAASERAAAAVRLQLPMHQAVVIPMRSIRACKNNRTSLKHDIRRDRSDSDDTMRLNACYTFPCPDVPHLRSLELCLLLRACRDGTICDPTLAGELAMGVKSGSTVRREVTVAVRAMFMWEDSNRDHYFPRLDACVPDSNGVVVVECKLERLEKHDAGAIPSGAHAPAAIPSASMLSAAHIASADRGQPRKCAKRGLESSPSGSASQEQAQEQAPPQQQLAQPSSDSAAPSLVSLFTALHSTSPLCVDLRSRLLSHLRRWHCESGILHVEGDAPFQRVVEALDQEFVRRFVALQMCAPERICTLEEPAIPRDIWIQHAAEAFDLPGSAALVDTSSLSTASPADMQLLCALLMHGHDVTVDPATNLAPPLPWQVLYRFFCWLRPDAPHAHLSECGKRHERQQVRAAIDLALHVFQSMPVGPSGTCIGAVAALWTRRVQVHKLFAVIADRGIQPRHNLWMLRFSEGNPRRQINQSNTNTTQHLLHYAVAAAKAAAVAPLSSSALPAVAELACALPVSPASLVFPSLALPACDSSHRELVLSYLAPNTDCLCPQHLLLDTLPLPVGAHAHAPAQPLLRGASEGATVRLEELRGCTIGQVLNTLGQLQPAQEVTHLPDCASLPVASPSSTAAAHMHMHAAAAAASVAALVPEFDSEFDSNLVSALHVGGLLPPPPPKHKYNKTTRSGRVQADRATGSKH